MGEHTCKCQSEGAAVCVADGRCDLATVFSVDGRGPSHDVLNSFRTWNFHVRTIHFLVPFDDMDGLVVRGEITFQGYFFILLDLMPGAVHSHDERWI